MPTAHVLWKLYVSVSPVLFLLALLMLKSTFQRVISAGNFQMRIQTGGTMQGQASLKYEGAMQRAPNITLGAQINILEEDRNRDFIFGVY